MPEGDTIHKIANFLAPRLVGCTLRDVQMADVRGARRCTGRRIVDVRAAGKHLFIALDNDTALRSHLGMYGSWHRYAPGEAWRKPRSRASLVLTTDADVFVCFNAKELEVVAGASVRARILGSKLGPDLTVAGADIGLAVRRAREMLDADTLIADVLLDQRAACGIGNVYKSEVLFIERRLPQTPFAQVADAELARLYATAAGLLQKNLGGGRRVTRFEQDKAGRLWVYGRRGLPCLRCEGRITAQRMGRHHRGTHWCAGCQT